ncbi:Phage putative head morphogenesis protein, SPP1 gp7 family OS=Bosea thiooxidans OX=53254 GN=SAMN05660750_03337 PE=4 SV=1 [Bosea thiooxidans]|uniref:Phage putative head morphogenesis protein, SPP1 gp7 family n=1 Tax=Bosea thiooxidans TaxID=53254 RepID=A0A1T5FLJ0_9HYPH|nr:phage minor head protein [Bosea thiooxidans]SKB97039.1 phage putative head morphogenesis protein, SPP1 gp7 family [Bosea thiooxidans]
MNVQNWIREATTTKRKRVVLRPISATYAFEAALLAPTNKILKRMAAQVAQDVLPATISAKRQMMRDDLNWFERAMRALRDFADGFVDGLRSEWRDAFDTEEGRNRRKWNEAVRSAIGIDLGAVLQAEGIGGTIDAAVLRNVSLVRGLSQDVAKRLSAKLLDGLTRGLNNREIEKIITTEFGIARRRAKLIARDQAGSFNGDLNRIRQTAMGVTEYVWSTSLDERVRGNPEGKYPNARPSHWAREGKTFRWDKPPSDGHPGQPINCRCTARAVIEF